MPHEEPGSVVRARSCASSGSKHRPDAARSRSSRPAASSCGSEHEAPGGHAERICSRWSIGFLRKRGGLEGCDRPDRRRRGAGFVHGAPCQASRSRRASGSASRDPSPGSVRSGRCAVRRRPTSRGLAAPSSTRAASEVFGAVYDEAGRETFGAARAPAGCVGRLARRGRTGAGSSIG